MGAGGLDPGGLRHRLLSTTAFTPGADGTPRERISEEQHRTLCCESGINSERREGDLNSRGARHQWLSRPPPSRTRLPRHRISLEYLGSSTIIVSRYVLSIHLHTERQSPRPAGGGRATPTRPLPSPLRSIRIRCRLFITNKGLSRIKRSRKRRSASTSLHGRLTVRPVFRTG